MTTSAPESSVSGIKSSSVHLDGVGKFYEEGARRLNIFNNLTNEFLSGEFTVLLGKSGSGKSTLLNLLAGIDNPSCGEIWVGDVPISRLSDYERTVFRRRRIGIVFQFYNLIPTLTAFENVTLPLELLGYNDHEIRDRAGELLERVGLSYRSHFSPDKLSGGEKQRVAIARALVHDPVVLLADEPTGNLDADTGMDVLNLMFHLVRGAGKTMIMATHSADVLPFADKIYNIQNGQLVLSAGKRSVARNV